MLKIDWQNQKGIISLILIFIIAFLTLSAILAVSFLSSADLNLALQDQQANQSLYLSQTCAEIALIKLKKDIDYIGNESLDIQGVSCQIRPILGIGNQNRTVQTMANYQNQVRKIQIKIAKVRPQLQITSWQEVPEF